MRDGQYIGTRKTSETSTQDIINMMVGRVIYEQPKSQSAVAPNAEVVLEVSGLNSGKMVQDVNFCLYREKYLVFMV